MPSTKKLGVVPRPELLPSCDSTVAHGKTIEIPTDTLTEKIADSVGLDVLDPIDMELLVSRDIFKKNRGSREQILRFGCK